MSYVTASLPRSMRLRVSSHYFSAPIGLFADRVPRRYVAAGLKTILPASSAGTGGIGYGRQRFAREIFPRLGNHDIGTHRSRRDGLVHGATLRYRERDLGVSFRRSFFTRSELSERWRAFDRESVVRSLRPSVAAAFKISDSHRDRRAKFPSSGSRTDPRRPVNAAAEAWTTSATSLTHQRPQTRWSGTVPFANNEDSGTIRRAGARCHSGRPPLAAFPLNPRLIAPTDCSSMYRHWRRKAETTAADTCFVD